MRHMHALLLTLLLAGPLAVVPARAQNFDVLGNANFQTATRNFSATDTLELAAHINMTLRQYERAIPMYEALLKKLPNREDLWAMLASAYNQVDEPREALDAANIAITLAPHYPHFYAERGIAALLVGQYRQSVDDLQHFVKSFPVNARARFYLGLAQAAQGENDAARASLLRAQALNPALGLSVSYYLGLIFASEGQIGLSRQLLADTESAFDGSALPMKDLVAGQLRALDSSISSRIRAATHESDARIAPVPALK